MAILEGKHVRLEQLSFSHTSDLWKHTGNDAELWKWVLVKYPIPKDENGMRGIIRQLLDEASEGAREPWAVIDLRSNECVGSTSYLDLKAERKTLEIGSTFYGQIARRTAINTETKYLLLREAFETRGYERVQFKADNLNIRSLTAIERIGGSKEGVMRNHFIRRDGTRRDTVIYSIIRSEWPSVSLHLQELLIVN
jgi:N-acetyltransferase